MNDCSYSSLAKEGIFIFNRIYIMLTNMERTNFLRYKLSSFRKYFEILLKSEIV